MSEGKPLNEAGNPAEVKDEVGSKPTEKVQTPAEGVQTQEQKQEEPQVDERVEQLVTAICALWRVRKAIAELDAYIREKLPKISNYLTQTKVTLGNNDGFELNVYKKVKQSADLLFKAYLDLNRRINELTKELGVEKVWCREQTLEV